MNIGVVTLSISGFSRVQAPPPPKLKITAHMLLLCVVFWRCHGDNIPKQLAFCPRSRKNLKSPGNRPRQWVDTGDR